MPVGEPTGRIRAGARKVAHVETVGSVFQLPFFFIRDGFGLGRGARVGIHAQRLRFFFGVYIRANLLRRGSQRGQNGYEVGIGANYARAGFFIG